MSIVVTGATGQLGNLVIQELLRRTLPDQVVAIARDRDKAAEIAARGVEVRIADYTEPSTLTKAFRAGDKVLLISSSELGQRVPQHAAVIAAAKQSDAALLVYTSMLGGPSATFTIAEELAATEATIIASAVPYVILRNGWYNENYTAGLGMTLTSGAVFGCADDGRIASASRLDYAAAAASVLTGAGHESAVYELSGDTAWTLPEYAAEVTAQSGQQIAYTNLSEEGYRDLMLSAGWPAHFATALADADRAIARGELAATSGDLSRLIGRPTIPIGDSIATALRERPDSTG